MARSFVVMLLLAPMLAGPAGAAGFGLDLAASFDDTGGNAFDVDARFSPVERLTFTAGAGRSRASDETAELDGTLLNAGVSYRGERAGASLDFRTFDDGGDYRTRTAGARAWIAAGDFEIALLARQRATRIGFTLELPLRELHREIDYGAVGGGLELSFARGNVSAYAMALRYEYDEDFDEFLAFAGSPQLAQRPRIEALVGSIMTQAQGAIDRQWGAGVERQFGRRAVSVDLASVHDAVLDAGSTSLAVTYHVARSARIDWSLTAGYVDSEVVGDIAFLGMSVGITN